MTTSQNNRCHFEVDHSQDAMPWEKLHNLSAVFSWKHGDVDGIGGRRPLGKRREDDPYTGDNELGTEAAEMIREAQRMVELAEQSMRLAVMTVRENGATWDEIGGWLNVTKQAAQQRYGRKRP